MSRPVFVHIGLQKTGTSYLQTIFAASSDALAAQGLDLVPGARRAAFWLMLDVRGRLQSHDPAEAAEVLRRLPDTLRSAPGSRALISEESFSPATDAQIERFLAALGDREVHVVLTCRDLARQIPSVWQQGLQSGKSVSLRRYVKRLRRFEGTANGIWWQKDVPAVLERWSRHVPPERIHVVTVPPSGSDPGLLLGRFCSVLGVDPATLDQGAAGRANRGLRLEQAEVLRRVNARIPKELKRRDAYGNVGKRFLSVRILGGAEGRPIRLPAEAADWCREVSQRYVDFLRDGGFDVVGDLADLMPVEASFAAGPQKVTERQVADAAVQALSEIVNQRLSSELDRPVPASRWGRLRGRLSRPGR